MEENKVTQMNKHKQFKKKKKKKAGLKHNIEEGGGFRMGNTCIPVADSFWYMAKLIQYCKVK